MAVIFMTLCVRVRAHVCVFVWVSLKDVVYLPSFVCVLLSLHCYGAHDNNKIRKEYSFGYSNTCTDISNLFYCWIYLSWFEIVVLVNIWYFTIVWEIAFRLLSQFSFDFFSLLFCIYILQNDILTTYYLIYATR